MRAPMVSPPQPPRELGYVSLAEVSEDETFRLRSPGEVSSLAQSIAQVGQLFPIEVRELGGKLQPLTGFRRLRALRLLHRNRVLIRSHGEIPDEVAALIAAADAIDNRALEVEELRELHERYAAMGWSTPALQELIARAIERATERLEDLEARLRGEAPPDRSIVDEDELDDEEDGSLITLDALAEQGLPESAASTPDAPAGEAAGPTPAPLVRPPAEVPTAPLLGGVWPLEQPTQSPAQRVEVTVGGLARDMAERLSEITQDFSTLVDHWGEVPEDLRGILSDQLIYYSQLGSWLNRSSGEDK